MEGRRMEERRVSAGGWVRTGGGEGVRRLVECDTSLRSDDLRVSSGCV